MYWFETTDTIPDGVGFSHFDVTHGMWLGVFVAIAVLLSAWYCRLDKHGRRKLQIAVAALIVLDEAFKWFSLLIGGNASVSYLPFHLCSINIIFISVHVFKPFKWLDEFLYLICVPAGLVALLFPSWMALPLANCMHIHSFTVHILLAAYPIMMTVGGDIVPSVRRLLPCLGLLLGMAAAVYGINLWLDTNFMFLMEADPGNPLLWFEEHWGRHWLGFPVILPVVIALMYAIVYAIRAIAEKRRSSL